MQICIFKIIYICIYTFYLFTYNIFSLDLSKFVSTWCILILTTLIQKELDMRSISPNTKSIFFFNMFMEFKILLSTINHRLMSKMFRIQLIIF